MSKKTQQLEKIRRELALLSDDITWKLEDLVLGIGDLLDNDKKQSADFLKGIKTMDESRRRLLKKYLNALDIEDTGFIKDVEEIWPLEAEEFSEALEELEKTLAGGD